MGGLRGEGDIGEVRCAVESCRSILVMGLRSADSGLLKAAQGRISENGLNLARLVKILAIQGTSLLI